MICSNCATENRAGRRFCVECGASLSVGCPSCETPYEAGEKFCGTCGSPVDHLMEWSRTVPINVLTLARPELLDKRPAWGAGKRNFVNVSLEPLPEPAMRALLTGLVPGLPDRAAKAIVVRADGIPLYAVETVRMLLAEQKLVLEGNTYRPTGDLADLAVPTTLTALIGSRLDALAPDDRTLIQDAAAYGQSFTLAGLAAVSGTAEVELQPHLARLVHAEMLTLTVDPRSPEQGQYAFRYLESLGSDELAGALAGHYLAAFANAAPGGEAEALEAQARIALRAAADRAGALGAHEQAVSLLDQALTVTHDDRERAELLEHVGEHAETAGRPERAEEALRHALTLWQAVGDRPAAARGSAALARALLTIHLTDTLVEEVEGMAAAFEDMPPDPGVVALNGQLARAMFLMRRDHDSLLVADRVLQAAERLDLAPVIADTLITKGGALCALGRVHEGMGLLEAGIRLADQRGLLATSLRGRINVGFTMGAREPAVAATVLREGLRDARRLGFRGSIPNLVANLAGTAYFTGDSDVALAEIDEALAMDPDPVNRAWLISNAAAHRFLRGDPADELMAELEEDLRHITDPQFVAFMGTVRAIRAFAAGDYERARAEALWVARTDQARAPISLAFAGRYALFARDARAAVQDRAALAALGQRGAANDARLRELDAGLAALEGRTEFALEAYRQNLAVWHELGMRPDAAMTGLEMVTLLDPAGARIRAAGAAARKLLVELRLAPFLDRLDAALTRAEARPGDTAAALPTR